MTNPATRTARGTMLLAAIEHNYPADRALLRDPLAEHILSPGACLLARATRLGWLRDGFIRALERAHPGTWAGIACRKRYIDEQLTAALSAGCRAVVSLGAGLDTRAYRIPRPPGVPYFEVDLPENIARKRRWLLDQFGAVPPDVVLVEVDFDRDDLGRALAAHGLPPDAPRFFLWEGVTQYLTEAGVRATLEYLSHAPSGSRLVFSYVVRDFITGADLHGLPALHRKLVVVDRLWHFGLSPADVDRFLAEYAWRTREHIGAPEFLERYVRPAGRDLTVMAIERLVLAEKP